MYNPNEVIALADSLATRIGPSAAVAFTAAMHRAQAEAYATAGFGGFACLVGFVILMYGLVKAYPGDLPNYLFPSIIAFGIGVPILLTGIVDLNSLDFRAAQELVGLFIPATR